LGGGGNFAGPFSSESMGSKLEVLDVETNETTIYYSNRQAAKALDCSE